MVVKLTHAPGDAVMPLISIIVVVFNGAAEIEATLHSALVQDSTSFEIIVIDGGSKDGTLRSSIAIVIGWRFASASLIGVSMTL